MQLKIITDSACDLPPELISKFNIEVLPFMIRIDDAEYVDGSTITPNEVYNAIREDKVPTTAQVPMETLLATFAKYAQKQVPCLYISFSSKLSGTYNTACLVAAELQRDYPDWQISLIDTRSGSLGQGLIVLEAAKQLQDNVPAEQIIKRARERANNNVEHVFSVDDLNYLYRGGRVNYASAFIGGILNVKPILHVKDGLMIPFQKVRGEKGVIKKIAELVQERSLGHPDQLIAITHADDINKAHQLEEQLKSQGYNNVLINVVGSVLGCHIGLGGVAAFFVNSNLTQPNLP